MRRWKSWEEETTTLEYQFTNDPQRFRLTHQTSFARRHLKFWSNHHILRWPACFIRQFVGSVSKTDYFILRHGFIMAHFPETTKFNFQKFIRRALDRDFQVVVGMSLWVWNRTESIEIAHIQGIELGYKEVYLLSSGLATLALASVLSNLDMEMDPETRDYRAFTELLPLRLLTLVILITFCPFNIVYRSSRFFLIQCAFHCICAPLYKVTLSDFFLADQLTSQVQAIRSLVFYIYYYGWGDFKQRRNTSKSCDCLRCLYEEKDSMQGYNALKYFSTIVAVCMKTAYTMKTAYSRKNALSWKVMALTSSTIAATVNIYWDIVMD